MSECKTNDETSRGGWDQIPIIFYFFIFFGKIYISFLSFTPTKNHAPLFLESPPKKSLFLQKYKWRTDSIIAPRVVIYRIKIIQFDTQSTHSDILSS